MSGSNDDRKRELECLRLASDLMRLARHHLNPDLKAHCVAMAKIWSGEADGKGLIGYRLCDGSRASPPGGTGGTHVLH